MKMNLNLFSVFTFIYVQLNLYHMYLFIINRVLFLFVFSHKCLHSDILNPFHWEFELFSRILSYFIPS